MGFRGNAPYGQVQMLPRCIVYSLVCAGHNCGDIQHLLRIARHEGILMCTCLFDSAGNTSGEVSCQISEYHQYWFGVLAITWYLMNMAIVPLKLQIIYYLYSQYFYSLKPGDTFVQLQCKQDWLFLQITHLSWPRIEQLYLLRWVKGSRFVWDDSPHGLWVFNFGI